MIPVSRYVDMNAGGFKDKSDFEIWHMLDEVSRQMVLTEYIGDRIEKAILELGEKVGEAVLSVTLLNKKEGKSV